MNITFKVTCKLLEYQEISQMISHESDQKWKHIQDISFTKAMLYFFMNYFNYNWIYKINNNNMILLFTKLLENYKCVIKLLTNIKILYRFIAFIICF